MMRVVPVPLASEPAVLWGLRWRDLIWVASGVVADLAVWHQPMPPVLRGLAMVLLSAGALGLGALRYQDMTGAQWLWVIGRYALSRRLYLPK